MLLIICLRSQSDAKVRNYVRGFGKVRAIELRTNKIKRALLKVSSLLLCSVLKFSV